MKRIACVFFWLGILFFSFFTLISCEQNCPHPTLIQTVTEPTCDQAGYTLNECTLCGFRFVSNPKDPKGHSYRETVLSATCTANGYTLRTCTDCNCSETVDATEALGHTWNSTTVLPTCTKDGYTLTVCSVCDSSFQSDLVPADGHHYTVVTDYPTIVKAGMRTQRCFCGDEHTVPLPYSDVFPGATVSDTAVLAKGLDVSLYQHKTDQNGSYLPLNWTAIQEAGFQFAILKAGSTPRTVEIQGQTYFAGGIDPVFEMNYRDAKAIGLSLGVYFYTYADTLERVRSDAELLMSWLNGKQLEYPIYFDLEDASIANLDKETITEFCITFLTVLQENGYYGALYSNNDWLVNRLDTERLQRYFDIWYSRYPSTTETSAEQTFQWNSEKYGPQMGMWQYTNHGVIDVIESIEFDFNYAYRDYPSIIKKYGYNGYAPSSP